MGINDYSDGFGENLIWISDLIRSQGFLVWTLNLLKHKDFKKKNYIGE